MENWDVAMKFVEMGVNIVPTCPGNHSGMHEKHISNCESPGKKALVKWKDVPKTTDADIEKWSKRWPTANIAVRLGKVSNMVRLDIDGAGGEELYKKYFGDDDFQTVEFTTPSGGRGLLFRLSENQTIKTKRLPCPGEKHSELALLGDGHLSVVPPSVHKNGGLYTWVKGRSIYDIEPALLPEAVEKVFMVDDMPANGLEVQNSQLQVLAQKCKVFRAALSGDFSTSQPNSFAILSLLLADDQTKAAEEFSKLILPYDSKAQETLDTLVSQGTAKPTKCTTLGCSENDIKLCIGNVKYSKRGSVVNKPIQHLKNEQGTDLEAAGFILNDEGNITGVNGNKFAKMILIRHVLLYTEGGRFYIYRDGVYEAIDDNNLSRLLREIVHEFQDNAWKPKLEYSYFEALKRETVRVDKLDADRNFLNLKNGMLNIRTGELLHHSPKYHSCIRIPIEFDPKAEAVRFKNFLNEIFVQDASLIQLVGEIMGYCLTGETRAQKAFMFYGHGANGKSVLAAIIRALVGKENVASVPLRELQNSFARLDLVDKTVNLVTEAEFDSKGMATEIFKAMVSGDVIRVEIKNGASFSYAPMAKFISCHNNLPYSRDHRHGLIRRLIILPFRRQFTEEEQDLDLVDKLLEELPGIMNFALEGLQRLQENNYKFTKCAAVQELLEDFTRNINPMVAFVDECISINANNRLFNGDAWNGFKEWCRQNGHKTSAEITRQRFMAEIKAVLEEKHIPFDKGKRGDRYLSGIFLDLTKLNDADCKNRMESEVIATQFNESEFKRRTAREVCIDID